MLGLENKTSNLEKDVEILLEKLVEQKLQESRLKKIFFTRNNESHKTDDINEYLNTNQGIGRPYSPFLAAQLPNTTTAHRKYEIQSPTESSSTSSSSTTTETSGG